MSTHMNDMLHTTPDSLDEAMRLVRELRARCNGLEEQNAALIKELDSIKIQHEEIHHEHENARMFMSAIDQCSESIFFTDVKGRILYANRSFENNSGYQREEILGKTPRILKSGAHDPEFYREMWATILRGEIWRARMTNRRKDGSLYHEEANIAPVRNDNGEIASFVSVRTDITELLKSQDTLRKMNAELSRSNLELEQFAYVASHDLQEPLRAVSSCMQLLEKHHAPGLDDRAREFIRHAVGACRRMRDLIEGLLTLSRVEAAAGHLVPTDTNEVFGQACTNLSHAIETSESRIDHTHLPLVCAHPQMLLHLFQNLLGNAIKFSGGKPPRVHVSARRKGDFWEFSVRDEGIGIAEEHFERIFQLFQRLHDRDDYPGTGLGLAICRKIVAHHGGGIRVESAMGKGTTFHFTLPAPQAPNASCPPTIPHNPMQHHELRTHPHSAG